MGQTFQELSDIVKSDLLKLRNKKEKGFSGCGFYDFSKFDFQDYFYEEKQKNPKRYERMHFNTNGDVNSSEDLGDILSKLKLSGFLRTIEIIAGDK